MKIKMTWRGFVTLCLMCAVAVGCVASDKKLTPAKEVEPTASSNAIGLDAYKLKIADGIAPSTGDSPGQIILYLGTNNPPDKALWSEGTMTAPSNTVFMGKAPYHRVVWPEQEVIISRPEWLLATNWLTTAYLLPAVREVAKPEGNLVTVIQRSAVTSNFVMVVSWQVATNRVTNTFVMQSLPVPEWSGQERWAQELVQAGR